MASKEQLPGDDGDVDIDAAFNDLVARFDTAPADDSLRPGQKPPSVISDPPASEDTAAAEATEKASGPAKDTANELPSWDEPVTESPVLGARDYELREPPEEFVPAKPPALKAPSLIGWVSWVPVVAVPCFFIFCAIAWKSVPAVVILTAIVVFVAGAGMLVSRLRTTPPEADGDDGARV